MIILFNIPGILILAISFGVAFGIGHLAGTYTEGPLMMIAGPLAAAGDLYYRLVRGEGHWFHPNWGGHLCFIPVWLLGILWLVLGVVYTVQGLH